MGRSKASKIIVAALSFLALALPSCAMPGFTPSATDTGSYRDPKSTCLVFFDSRGGTKYDPQTVNKGQHASNPGKPQKINCRFQYWETAQGKQWDFVNDTVESDMTLYAVYEEIPYVSSASTSQDRAMTIANRKKFASMARGSSVTITGVLTGFDETFERALTTGHLAVSVEDDSICSVSRGIVNAINFGATALNLNYKGIIFERIEVNVCAYAEGITSLSYLPSVPDGESISVVGLYSTSYEGDIFFERTDAVRVKDAKMSYYSQQELYAENCYIIQNTVKKTIDGIIELEGGTISSYDPSQNWQLYDRLYGYREDIYWYGEEPLNLPDSAPFRFIRGNWNLVRSFSRSDEGVFNLELTCSGAEITLYGDPETCDASWINNLQALADYSSFGKGSRIDFSGYLIPYGRGYRVVNGSCYYRGGSTSSNTYYSFSPGGPQFPISYDGGMSELFNRIRNKSSVDSFLGKVYSWNGVLEDFVIDVHGTGRITEPYSGATIPIRNATTDLSAITYADGVCTYTPLYDARSTMAGYASGDYVQIYAMVAYEKGQYSLDVIVNGTSMWSPTLNVYETPGIVWDVDKKDDLHYGDVVHFTFQVSNGYELNRAYHRLNDWDSEPIPSDGSIVIGAYNRIGFDVTRQWTGRDYSGQPFVGDYNGTDMSSQTTYSWYQTYFSCSYDGVINFNNKDYDIVTVTPLDDGSSEFDLVLHGQDDGDHFYAHFDQNVLAFISPMTDSLTATYNPSDYRMDHAMVCAIRNNDSAAETMRARLFVDKGHPYMAISFQNNMKKVYKYAFFDLGTGEHLMPSACRIEFEGDYDLCYGNDIYFNVLDNGDQYCRVHVKGNGSVAIADGLDGTYSGLLGENQMTLTLDGEGTLAVSDDGTTRYLSYERDGEGGVWYYDYSDGDYYRQHVSLDKENEAFELLERTQAPGWEGLAFYEAITSAVPMPRAGENTFRTSPSASLTALSIRATRPGRLSFRGEQSASYWNDYTYIRVDGMQVDSWRYTSTFEFSRELSIGSTVDIVFYNSSASSSTLTISDFTFELGGDIVLQHSNLPFDPDYGAYAGIYGDDVFDAYGYCSLNGELFRYDVGWIDPLFPESCWRYHVYRFDGGMLQRRVYYRDTDGALSLTSDWEDCVDAVIENLSFSASRGFDYFDGHFYTNTHIQNDVVELYVIPAFTGALTFAWGCDSEGGCDWAYWTDYNGMAHSLGSGLGMTGSTVVSVTAGNAIRLGYRKDGSVNSGLDFAYFHDFRLEPEPSGDSSESSSYYSW